MFWDFLSYLFDGMQECADQFLADASADNAHRVGGSLGCAIGGNRIMAVNCGGGVCA